MKPKQTYLRDVLKVYGKALLQYPWMNFFVMMFFVTAKFTTNLGIPMVLGGVIDTMSTQPDAGIADFKIFFWIFLGLVIVNNAFNLIALSLMGRLQTNVLKELMDNAFLKLQKKSYGFFSGVFTGSLVAQLKRYTRGFETLHDNFIFTYWNACMQMLAIFLLMGTQYPMLSLTFFVFIGLFVLLSYKLAVYKSSYDKVAAKTDSAVTAVISDTITNILAVKSFGKRNTEIARMSDATEAERVAERKAWLVEDVNKRIIGVFAGFSHILFWFLLIRYWMAGTMSMGNVVMIQGWLMGLMGLLWDIGRTMQNTSKSLAYGSEMLETFENGEEIFEPENPLPCTMNAGAIDFDAVSFAYESHGTRVFSDFTLHIKPGEKIGLVGKSGAGKSTITKLLLRFVDPSTGSVTIDGQNTQHVALDALRQHMTYVPQEPVLFHRTLKENIKYGAPDATDAEIVAAAKMAHADEFIETLPNGYETMVGERGIKLSGGQRQRIAIARAMLKKAPILILDEATSSLDSVSEKYIQESLHTLMQERTTIVVAHRLSTLMEMDRIIVLENGIIIEQGTHAELVAKKGAYDELWQHQSS
jgi:ATP-binding cassette subfamily B protein